MFTVPAGVLDTLSYSTHAHLPVNIGAAENIGAPSKCDDASSGVEFCSVFRCLSLFNKRYVHTAFQGCVDLCNYSLLDDTLMSLCFIQTSSVLAAKWVNFFRRYSGRRKCEFWCLASMLQEKLVGFLFINVWFECRRFSSMFLVAMAMC